MIKGNSSSCLLAQTLTLGPSATHRQSNYLPPACKEAQTNQYRETIGEAQILREDREIQPSAAAASVTL